MNGWRAVWMVAMAALLAGRGEAKIVEQTLTYPMGDVTARGFLARDDAVTGAQPGVLVVHEWWGLNDYTKRRARQLAALGYVALAADMYGDGKVAATPQEAGQLAGAVRGGTLLRTRAAAALATLRAQPGVDPHRMAAIGYCFGGTTVLELAYSGADLAGVVSFHGGLTVPGEQDMGRIKAKILICHGDADPHVTPAVVRACLDGLTRAKADWQFIAYAGAVHAFTNPDSGNDPSRGVAYNEAADHRSWKAMSDFFGEIFATPAGG
jgi:dienelactone hydrolase